MFFIKTISRSAEKTNQKASTLDLATKKHNHVSKLDQLVAKKNKQASKSDLFATKTAKCCHVSWFHAFATEVKHFDPIAFDVNDI
jgi:hypothetical protein